MRKFLLYFLIGISCVASPINKGLAGAAERPNYQDVASSIVNEELITKYPWADVRAFGAKGDGIADDRPAIIEALNSPAQVIILPPGNYKISSGITMPNGKSLKGFGMNSTRIHYHGETGTAISVGTLSGGEISGFTLESKSPQQSGIYLSGSLSVLSNVKIEKFQDVSLRLGRAGAYGCYFARIENVYIHNKNYQGKQGILIDGQSIPNSNANTFINVFVSGKFTTLVHIKGNNNTWYSGDVEWDAEGSGVDDIWLIEGSGNHIISPYMESIKGVPKRIFSFTSEAFSNKIEDVYASFYVENFQLRNVDKGWANEVSFKPVGHNFPFPVQNVGLANLIPNSHFRIWKGKVPDGWAIIKGTFTQESIVVKGAAYSLKTSAESDNPIINCYLAGHSSSITGLPIERFKGKTVMAGVWVKTDIAGMGNLKIWTDGKGGGGYGNSVHSGDGSWQFVNAIAKVPADATYVMVQLRGFNSGTKGTGEVYFSESILVEGVHLPLPTPSFLNDSYSKMNGVFIHNQPIFIKEGDTTPSIKDGNIFKTANKQKTYITDFKDGSAGQKITVIFSDSNTSIDFTGARLKGNRGNVWYPVIADHMNCVFDGAMWYCDISSNSRRD